jgi:hypothetical protein
MRSYEFYTRATGKTAEAAFKIAREQAQRIHGHSGHTGTIADKDSFLGVMVPEGKDPIEYARDLISSDDPRFIERRGCGGLCPPQCGWLSTHSLIG